MMCWNSPRMRMKMHWKVVERRHSRRFAIAAADAACRTRTFFECLAGVLPELATVWSKLTVTQL